MIDLKEFKTIHFRTHFGGKYIAMNRTFGLKGVCDYIKLGPVSYSKIMSLSTARLMSL